MSHRCKDQLLEGVDNKPVSVEIDTTAVDLALVLAAPSELFKFDD